MRNEGSEAREGIGDARRRFGEAIDAFVKRATRRAKSQPADPQLKDHRSVVAIARSMHISKSSLYQYMRGENLPDYGTLEVIIEKLDLSTDERELLTSLHNAVTQVPPDPVGHWPIVPPEFCGREAQAERLDQLTASPTGSIVVLTGIGGVGKTALAVSWARRKGRRFPDGRYYVDLQGYGTSNPLQPDDVVLELLSLSGMPESKLPADLDSRLGIFKGWVESGRRLILLDNVRDVAQIRDLLPIAGPGCIVVTSRNEMSSLVALTGAKKIHVAPLDLPSSTNLIAALINESGTTPASALVELSRRCGRLPLALRIAAEQVNLQPALPIQEVIDDLANEQRTFDLLELEGDPQAALRTVFLWSYGHLPRELQMVFRMTGLSPGSHYDRYGLAALLDLPMEKVKESTRALVQINLFEERYVGRFGSHDLLAVYGRELSTQTDSAADRCAAVQRIGDYYAITSAVASDTIYGSSMEEHLSPLTFTNVAVRDRERAIKWMSLERENIATFASECERFETEASTIDVSCTMSQFMIGTGHARQARDLHAAASVSASRRNRPDVEASCLDRHAQAILSTGDAHAALDSIERGLTLLDAAPDNSTRADLLHTKATCEARVGNFDQALEDLKQVLALPRASVTDWANTAAALADVYEDLGRYGLAQETYEDVLRDERIRPGTRARVTNNLALIEYRVGRYQEAAHGFEESARLKRQIGDLQAAITSEANLALALFHLGQSSEALLKLRAANEAAEELDDRWSAVTIGSNLAGMFHEAGLEDDAIRTHKAAVEAAREIRSLPLLAVVLNDYGETLARQDESDKAFEQHKEAYGVASQLSLAYETARALDGLGTALRLNGEVDRPRQAWNEALEIFTSLRTPNAASIAKKLAALPQSA